MVQHRIEPGFGVSQPENPVYILKIEPQFLENLQPFLDEALNGSPAALNHLIALCTPKLIARARLEIGNSMSGTLGASDLAQLTCIKAYQKIHSFRGKTARRFWKWLRRIQRNQFLDLARKASLDELPLNPNEISSATQVPLIDPKRTPRTAAIKAEQQKAVQEAITRLPKLSQDVVRLRSAEKLTFQEIARELEMSSEDAARGCFNRALEILRDELRFHDES